MGDERRFTEEEVDAILTRAVHLGETGSPSPAVTGSLSLTELKQIAGEVGIGPHLVEAAAADLVAGAPAGSATWLGPPARARATRLLDATLSQADIELLLRLVERRWGRKGMVSEALGRVVWASESAQLTTQVSISEQEGKTRVDVEGRYPGQMRPLLHLIPGAMGLTLAVSLAAPAGIFGAPLIAAAVGGGALGAALGRGIWEAVARTTTRKGEALADEIAAAAVDLGDSAHPAEGDS